MQTVYAACQRTPYKYWIKPQEIISLKGEHTEEIMRAQHQNADTGCSKRWWSLQSLEISQSRLDMALDNLLNVAHSLSRGWTRWAQRPLPTSTILLNTWRGLQCFGIFPTGPTVTRQFTAKVCDADALLQVTEIHYMLLHLNTPGGVDSCSLKTRTTIVSKKAGW